VGGAVRLGVVTKTKCDGVAAGKRHSASIRSKRGGIVTWGGVKVRKANDNHC